jgi:flagellar basal-body rod protein FlgC
MPDYASLLAISATGLRAERLRLEVASQNLANVHAVVSGQGEPYRPLRVVAHASGDGAFEGRLAAGAAVSEAALRGVDHVEIVPMGVEPRLDYDPGNPQANAKGLVKASQVNVADEMLTVMSSVRAYEANIRAMNAVKAIAERALDIGSSRA